MRKSYRQGIVAALMRIRATVIQPNESAEALLAAVAGRVEDLAKSSNPDAGDDADLDALVNRFLTWPVPAEVYPDGTPGQPGRTGTNLLSAPQAKAMLQHVLGG